MLLRVPNLLANIAHFSQIVRKRTAGADTVADAINWRMGFLTRGQRTRDWPPIETALLCPRPSFSPTRDHRVYAPRNNEDQSSGGNTNECQDNCERMEHSCPGSRPWSSVSAESLILRASNRSYLPAKVA
jgi:hypothetical protein